MAIAVKIFNISMHEKWRNSQCSQIRKDRDRATTQSTFPSCTQHVSVLYNKFRQTLAHTQWHTHRHGHTLSTQLLTHVYACHIIKHIKHIMGRVCHRHAYTLQPHTHTCLHWWEGQGLRKRGEAERLSLSYTQRHLQLLEQTQCLFGCLRCELTWRAKNELAKHVTKVTQHNGAAHTLKHTHKHTQACKQSSRSSLLEHTIRAA